MMTEFEIAYWHAMNIANPDIWQARPNKVIEQML